MDEATKKAKEISDAAFSPARNPLGAFMSPATVHDGVVKGKFVDRNASEKHFRAAHAQVTGKKKS